MRINEIIIKVSPWYQPHKIELFYSMQVDGKLVQWKEVFPDSDFESRAEQYLDFMKRKMIATIKEGSKKKR